MKLVMVSVKVKGVRYTGFVEVPTGKLPAKIKLTLEQIRLATNAPMNPNTCVEIGG